MPISQEKLTKMILAEFPDANIELKDLVGDQDHYELYISSPIFKNKTRVESHRLVNNALKGCLGGELHALSVKIKK